MTGTTSLTLYKAADVMPLMLCDVLIVDNDDSGSGAMAEDLTAAGYTVRTADNCFEAIGAVQRFQPRIVFIEINLPGWLDGCRLSRKIALLDSEISIILMSADFEALQRTHEYQAPAIVAAIAKPLPAGPIKRFVEHVCREKRRGPLDAGSGCAL